MLARLFLHLRFPAKRCTWSSAYPACTLSCVGTQAISPTTPQPGASLWDLLLCAFAPKQYFVIRPQHVKCYLLLHVLLHLHSLCSPGAFPVRAGYSPHLRTFHDTTRDRIGALNTQISTGTLKPKECTTRKQLLLMSPSTTSLGVYKHSKLFDPLPRPSNDQRIRSPRCWPLLVSHPALPTWQRSHCRSLRWLWSPVIFWTWSGEQLS